MIYLLHQAATQLGQASNSLYPKGFSLLLVCRELRYTRWLICLAIHYYSKLLCRLICLVMEENCTARSCHNAVSFLSNIHHAYHWNDHEENILNKLSLGTSVHRPAPSGVAAIHLALSVVIGLVIRTSWELIRPVFSPTAWIILSTMGQHHTIEQTVSHEIISTETWSAFQFLMFFCTKYRYSFTVNK